MQEITTKTFIFVFILQMPMADTTEDIVMTRQPEHSRLILKTVLGWAKQSGTIIIQVFICTFSPY